MKAVCAPDSLGRLIEYEAIRFMKSKPKLERR